MIYLTGDIHGGLRRFSAEGMAEFSLPPLTAEDYVIVCGDFGIPWGRYPYQDGAVLQGQPISWRDAKDLKRLVKLKATFLFVDGNHENFDLLESFDEQVWHGGRVHVLQDNVLHLIRGEVFTLADITFLAFGGAKSVDRYNRRLGISWWQREVANDQDYQNAVRNLARVGNNVDFVFSHTAPAHFTMPYMQELGFNPLVAADPTVTILSRLYRQIAWRWWYFGHYPINKVDRMRRARWIYDDIDALDGWVINNEEGSST